MSQNDSELLHVAQAKFADLSVAEEQLFRAAQRGEIASGLSGDETQDDPAAAAHWGSSRVVRAKCITWLCTNIHASRLVTHRGVELVGFRIEDELDLSHAEVRFPLLIRNSALTSRVLLLGTTLPMLSFIGSHINGLVADQANIAGSILLRAGFKCSGEIRLLNATIGGNLDFASGTISNPESIALSADGARIRGDVFFRDGFHCTGEIWFPGASVGGDFSCVAATVINSGARAITAHGMRVEGAVLLNNSTFEGEVRLLGATVGASIECQSTRFLNAGGRALTLDSATVKGAVIIRQAASVEGLFSATGVTIARGLQIRELVSSQQLRLDLRDAKVSTLWDDQTAWPNIGNLYLDGFQYDRIFEGSYLDAKTRIEWLKRQPPEMFLPQPYEHLAAALRRMGHERDAQQIIIEKNRSRGRSAKFPKQEWWWYRFFGRAIGYGYRPWRALAASLAIILFGTIIFATGFSNDLISPSKENTEQRKISDNITNGKRRFADDYPVFNPFTYSLESFIPLLRLDQNESWQPNANRGGHIYLWRRSVTTGGLLRYYLWLHVIAGWILTTLWVGAVTGLVKS